MRKRFLLLLLFTHFIKAQTQIDQIPGIIIQNDFDFYNSLKPIQVYYDNYVLIQCYNDRNRQAQLWLTDGIDNHTQLLLELQQSEIIYHIQVVDKTAFVFVHSARDSLLKIFRIYDNSIALDTKWTLKATLRDFRLLNDKIYFSGDDFTFIPEFYNYNYDINKKIINRIMKNAKSAYTKPILWNNQLFYLGSISEIDGSSLGKYNENKDSLELITLLDSAYLYYSDPKLVVQDSTFFYLFLNFVKLPGGEYYEYLIRSDGTKNGTYKLKEIKGPGILPESEAIIWKNQLYFDGSDPNDSIGAELYISDGTSNGSKLLKDLDPGEFSFFPGNFLEFNDKLFFSSIFDFGFNPLVSTDGTEVGTDFIAPEFRFIYGPISKMNDTLIFCAENSSHRNVGNEIHFYTLDGNIRVFDINQSSGNFGNSMLYQTIVTPDNVFSQLMMAQVLYIPMFIKEII